MRENDELYADSGEPVKESRGVSRGTALKVGGIGLAGALAAFMPGRASGAIRKKASNASCGGQGFVCILGNYPKYCGYDNYSYGGKCACLTVHYGKLRPTGAPIGACGENFFCFSTPTCSTQKDCPPGYFCSDGGCCGTPLCAPYCQQGSIGQAPPKGAHHTAFHK